MKDWVSLLEIYYDAIKRGYAVLYEEEWGQITVPPQIQKFLGVVGQCIDE